MTEEQIRQKAEKYADGWIADVTFKKYVREAFIAGAHSRDEEVKQWKESKRKLRLRLMQQIHELRNPWVSVEDRLPEDDRDCLFMGNHIPVCFGRYYSNSLSGAVWSCDDGYWTPAKEVTHWMPIPELKKEE